MLHTDEHNHAFIKNGRIANVLVFSEDAHDSNILDEIKTSNNYDDVVCLCWWIEQGNTDLPGLHWEWDGATFTPPTQEWLLANGLINPVPLIAE